MLLIRDKRCKGGVVYDRAWGVRKGRTGCEMLWSASRVRVALQRAGERSRCMVGWCRRKW